VRHPPGPEDRVAGHKPEGVLANLETNLALEDEEPLILLRMDVQRRPARLPAVGVVDAERTAGVGRRDLAVEAAIQEPDRRLVAINSSQCSEWNIPDRTDDIATSTNDAGQWETIQHTVRIRSGRWQNLAPMLGLDPAHGF